MLKCYNAVITFMSCHFSPLPLETSFSSFFFLSYLSQSRFSVLFHSFFYTMLVFYLPVLTSSTFYPLTLFSTCLCLPHSASFPSSLFICFSLNNIWFPLRYHIFCCYMFSFSSHAHIFFVKLFLFMSSCVPHLSLILYEFYMNLQFVELMFCIFAETAGK